MDGRDAMLAVGMNGEPLPAEHGFPVRMVVPGLYGYVSATKWLVDLELTRFDRGDAVLGRARLGAEGADPDGVADRHPAPVRPSSQAGKVAVAGVAWAQHRGIDEGRGAGRRRARGRRPGWPTCRRPTPGGSGCGSGTATSGQPRRSRSAPPTPTGMTQPGRQLTPFPSGATGWHAIEVTVVLTGPRCDGGPAKITPCVTPAGGARSRLGNRSLSG